MSSAPPRAARLAPALAALALAFSPSAALALKYTTTVADGTNPGNSNLCARTTTVTDLDGFTLQVTSSSGGGGSTTDTVTAVTVTLTGTNSYLALATVAVTDSSNTVLCSTSTLTSNTVSITGCSIGVTTTAASYKVRITPLAAPPKALYTLGGTVTAVTSTNARSYADTASATVTIDALAPADVTGFGGTPGNGQVTLSWTNPGDADFSQVLILRSTASIADAPADGSSYTAGNTLGASTVVYVGTASPQTNTGLTNGTAYYYKAFTKDTCGNYSAGVQIGPLTPVSPITAVGTLTLTPSASCTGIAVSAAYSGDSDANNTASVAYRVTGGGSWTTWANLAHSPSPYTTTITGLAQNTSYDVQVTFTDSTGVSGTNPVVGTTTTLNTCTQAGTVTATPGSGVINVTGPYSGDSNANNTATVEYKLTSSGTWTTWATLSHSASPYTSVITGLSSGTSYDVRFTYVDPDGISTGTAQQVITGVIPTANGVIAGAASATRACTSATVTAPYTGDSNANSTCQVEYRIAGTSTWTTWAVLSHVASPFSTTVTGLSAASEYELRVTYIDPDGVSGTNPQTLGPYAACGTTPGTVSQTHDCSSISVTAPYTDDSNANNTCLVEYKLSSSGTWTTWQNLAHAASPYATTISALTESSSYDVRVTYSDVDGVGANAQQTISSISLPACSHTLTISNPGGQPTGTPAAGTPQVYVGKAALSSSKLTITVTSIGVSNAAVTSPAVAGTDIQSLQLWDDTDSSGALSAGDTLLATGKWDSASSRWIFANLSYGVTAGTNRTLLLSASFAPGATSGNVFQFGLASTDVSVTSPDLVAAASITGGTFTIGAGALEGSINGAVPTVLILNPGPNAVTSGTFRLQVQVYDPSGIANSTVKLSTNAGVDAYAAYTFVAGDKNVNYQVGNACTTSADCPGGTCPGGGGVCSGNAAVFEHNLSLAPGAYALKIQASNASGASTSRTVMITAAPAGTGDGNLLVRDNSSQLCIDCHAMATHSSQTVGNKYGAWAVSCRDCHTPHNTTNIYLLRKTITPPAITSYQPARTVVFSTAATGSTTSTAVTSAPFVVESATTSDFKGPCQVCHTRTSGDGSGNAGTTAARWRNTGNSDQHHTTTNQPGACTGCHLHTTGFSPPASAESSGGSPCSTCHASIFTPMNGTSNHHHYMNNDGTTYPTSPVSSSQSDTNRKCLMCHVDHNIFRPDLNANAGRGYNLRTSVYDAVSTTAGFANTDFDASQTKGGICVSCHESAQTKSYADPDGTTTTPVLSKTDFSASPHNYTAAATVASGGINPSFNANCAKCHTDTMDKVKPPEPSTTELFSSTYPNIFGLHNGPLRSVTDPLAMWTYPGGAVPADPLGGSFCEQCHRARTDNASWAAKPTANKDEFGVATMSNQAERLYAIFNTAASYPFSHPINSATSIHKVTGEGTASGDGSLSGANRHVTCADCHNPHAAQAMGTATAGTAGMVTAWATNTAPTTDKLTDGTKAWAVNQWRGYAVKIVAGTGAGQTSAIYASGSNYLDVEFSTALDTTSQYVIVNHGRSEGTAATTGHPADGPVASVWGVVPTFPAQPTPPTYDDSGGTLDGAPFTGATFYNTVTYTRVETGATQGQQCVRCHSSWAYGSTPPNTPSGQPNSSSTAWSNTVGAAVVESDLANEFNPNNLSHHAVFGRGRNQPLVASATVTSTYNPNWPKFIGNGTTIYVTVSGSTVTLVGTTWPETVVPGWFIYLGSSAPAQGVAGWYEVTGVGANSTTLTVDRTITQSGNLNFFLTAGLGNNFVPPWGPWSTLQCTDCHASATTTDPLGPHGSAQKWILRSATAKTFAFYNGTGSTPTSVAQISLTPNDTDDLCLNCHRSDVYGDNTASAAVNPTNPTYARQSHPVDSGGGGRSLYVLPKWGIGCMNCHGGARVGAIHGQNVGAGLKGGAAAGASQSGKHLLAGATWYSVTLSTTTSSGVCWTKGKVTDAVNNCQQGHTATNFSVGTANYDYNAP